MSDMRRLSRTMYAILPLVVSAFLVLQSVPVTAQETGSISGTAIVTGTDFVVHVYVRDVEGQVVAETTTDGEGRYLVGGLSPGVYHVKFDDPVYGSFPKYSYGTSTRSRPYGDQVIVESGMTTSGIDYTFTATGEGWIEGRTYDAATGALALVAVGIGTGLARTELDGTYRRRVPVGSHTVQFSDNWISIYADQWWQGAGDVSLADAVIVGEGQVVRVDGALVPLCQGVEGPHSLGLVDPTTGLWHLVDCNTATMNSFYYGDPGDLPIMGDWDGDGIDTPGIYRQSDGHIYLRNSNNQGYASTSYFLGDPGDIPLAGDFDGDGLDTVSIYRPSTQTFHILNTTGENGRGLGAAEFTFTFGDLGDQPNVGDWDGDGVDEVGVHRSSTRHFYWRDTLTTGIATGSYSFGFHGDLFIAGDWGSTDGRETPAGYTPSHTRFYLHDVSIAMTFGKPEWLPIAGVTNLD
jgi:hypothetical protein